MRVSRKRTRGIILVLLSLMFIGCGEQTDNGGTDNRNPASTEVEAPETTTAEVTAEEFIARMIVAADKAVVTKMDGKTLLQAVVGDKNNTLQIDYLFTTHNTYDKETVASTSEITVESQYGSSDMVFNLVEEQGILYYYVKADSDWIKYESFSEKEEISRNFVSNMNLENAQVLGFETEGVQYNGKDVYKLSVELKDADIRELVFEAGMKWLFWAKEYATVELSDIAVTMDYYVDPQTAQVLKVEVSLEGMKNMLTEFGIYQYSAYFGNVLDVVELHECKLVYENISYEDYSLPKMSFEDKKNSKLVHQKDVPYTLHMLDAEVEVVCPAGWWVGEKGDSYIAFTRADNNIAIYYNLNFGFTKNDVLEDLYSVAEGRIENEGCISASVGPQMGVFDTYEMVYESGVEAFAYTEVKNSVLRIQVFDFTTNRAEWALEDVLKRVYIAE